MYDNDWKCQFAWCFSCPSASLSNRIFSRDRIEMGNPNEDEKDKKKAGWVWGMSGRVVEEMVS